MKKINNNIKIIIIIGILTLTIFVVILLKKIEENNYNNYNYEEYFGEQENKIVEEKKTIVVHITGEVNKPGVIELEEGKRIIDQTTPNMIQRISGIFERNPLISKEI